MSNVFFIVNHCILFIKLFLFIFLNLLLIPNTFSKILLVLLLGYIIKILLKYPQTRFHKLSKLRNYRWNLIWKYRLNSTLEHIYNISLLVIYIFGVTVTIFYLRIINTTKVIDLKEYYTIVKIYIIEHTSFDILLMGLLYFLAIVIYILIIAKILRYLKLQILRRHLYLINPSKNPWYYEDFFHNIMKKKNIFHLEEQICSLIEFVYKHVYFRYKKKIHNTDMINMTYKEKVILYIQPPVDPNYLIIKYPQIQKTVEFILLYSHHIILLFYLVYDLWFNNFIISSIFYILPWIFFYELYIRISKFIDDLHLPYDESFHIFLYANSLEVVNSKIILINGEIHDYNYFRKMYHEYIKKNFIKNRKNLD